MIKKDVRKEGYYSRENGFFAIKRKEMRGTKASLEVAMPTHRELGSVFDM
jgi:hypothetical protein